MPGHPGSLKHSAPPASGDALVSLAVRTTATAFSWLESWRNWLVGVWLAGAAALLVGLLTTGCRRRWRTRRKRPLTVAEVLDLLEDCKQEMGVYAPLALIETDAAASPALYGFIRPRLLLPAGLTESFSLPELRHVFLHELGHVKRGDIPLNWLTTLLLILHWFNPLVWYAFRRMQADRELACDALALSYSGDRERQFYGRTVIKVLEHFSCPARSPDMVGILENRNQMKAIS
ncbi:MAG: M56 family metallopeptidase, partial [Planctomycetes bacterium]|nr:M56 family metallopeptidase [Planctomycetota bacterium]